MDHQEMQLVLDLLKARWTREAPKAVLIYGRRAVPAAGFSLAELADVGLDENGAKGNGIPVDRERMTSLGCNVASLREFLRR